jgi:hypothetical protein
MNHRSDRLTEIPRSRAEESSSRTKSAGSSRRRSPSGFSAVSHSSPITATSTEHEATAVSIRSTKSTPGSMRRSMNTWSSPKRWLSRS